MQRVMLIVITCGLVLMLGACAVSGGGEARDERVTVTADDNGGSVELAIGQTLVIALPGNPSTGITWLGGDVPDVLEQVGEATFEPDSEAVGSPGVLSFEYDAISPGSGTIELSYARPWESRQPQATFRVDVTVR